MNHQQPGLVWLHLPFFFLFFSFFQIVGRLQNRLGEISGVTSVPYLGKGKEGGNWLAVVSKNTRSCAAVFVTTNTFGCLFVCPGGFWCVSITVSVTCLLRSGVQSSSSSSSTTTTTKRHGFRRPANRCVCLSVVTT